MAEPRRSQVLLLGGLAAAFALSAVTGLRTLVIAGVISLALFHRGAGRALSRVARFVLAPVLLLSLGSWAWMGFLGSASVPLVPFVVLALRASVISFVTFSVVVRADLLRALAPFPVPSRLLVLCLAQIHSLRRVATESRDGLRSRMVRRPGAGTVIRNAGGVTATLLALSTRNARDAADAMRSRGF